MAKSKKRTGAKPVEVKFDDDNHHQNDSVNFLKNKEVTQESQPFLILEKVANFKNPLNEAVIVEKFEQIEKGERMNTVKLVKLTEDAKIPSRANDTDTGYDLTFIGVDKIVGDVIFFKTGISLEPPAGTYFEVFPRSSISKLGLSLANSIGVIDEAYRGEILVPIRVHHNLSGENIKSTEVFASPIIEMFGQKLTSMTGIAASILKNQPRMTQLVLRKRLDCQFVEGEVSETARGAGGFGSSGSR